jgi:dTDP-4-dehydrorhamnose reductase
MTRILLIGSSGQVGQELQHSLASLGEIVTPDRGRLDLELPDSILHALQESEADVIVNAAAYTAVDRAESERERAMAINGTALETIAQEAERMGAFLVHYSTDYVFDGRKSSPYVEDDTPNPINVYGRSKLIGEEAIRKSGVAHFIFRTSWVYAAHGNNFLRTIMRLAEERSELKIVNDQFGAPTWAKTIAEITAQALEIRFNTGNDKAETNGVYNLTASGFVSWFGFAQAIINHARKIHPAMTVPCLIPISSHEYPLPALRPANSRLDTSKLRKTLGLRPPSWEIMLEECLARTDKKLIPGP